MTQRSLRSRPNLFVLPETQVSLPDSTGNTPFGSPLTELSEHDLPPTPPIPEHNTITFHHYSTHGTSKMSSSDSATAGSKDSPVKVGELLSEDGSNYDNWLKANKIQLRLKGAWNILDGTEKRPPPGSSASDLDSWDRRANVAVAQLALNMPLSLIGQLNIDAPHALYVDLNERFAKSADIRIVLASCALREKRIGPTQTMADHIKELRQARVDYLNAGGSLDNKEWKIIILISLGHGYWGRYAANFTGVDAPEDIITTLIFEERRIGADKILELAQAEATVSALVASRTTSRISSSNNAGGNRSSSSSPQKLNRTQCYNCGGRGHVKANCFAPGGGKQDNPPPWYRVPPHMAHLVNQSQTPPPASATLQETAKTVREFCLMATIACDHNDIWVLDSGASSSMCNDRLSFHSLVLFDQPQFITTAKAGDSLRAIGKGSIRATFKYDSDISIVTLNDVLYVPDLDSNLLSVTKLMDSHVSVSFTKDRCTLTKDGRPFGLALRVGSLYQVQLELNPDAALLISTAKDTRQDLSLWHRRLAHINERRVLEMFKNNSVKGLVLKDQTTQGRCTSCIIGKHAAIPSPTSTHRARYPLETLHSDLQFFDTVGLGGFKLAISFIDEYSGYMWQIPLKDKTALSVLSEFQRIDSLVEIQFKRRIRALHSDNGGEFVNHTMDAYLKSRGIIQHTIAPHRHEMNGLAERANRSSADCVRAMLADSKKPKNLWPLALTYYSDVRNFTSNSALDSNQTPHEVVYGSKPDVSHLRVFGCDAYVRVPPDSRKKLDAKSIKGIFVGLSLHSSYQILLPNRTIIKSKDVIFIESPDDRTISRQPELPPDNTTDQVNPADSASIQSPVLTDTIPSGTSSPDIPLALRKERRCDHTTDNYRQSKEQESTYAYMDNPVKALGPAQPRRVVQGHNVPLTMKEALSGPDKDEWQRAGAYELGMLLQHDVWDEVRRPQDTHVIRGKWVFNIKDEPTGLVFRARWVARGDFQLEDEYGELHASSGDFNVARLLLALSALEHTTLRAIDINSAYLHSDLVLDSPIYVEYPHGFHPSTSGDYVCKLKRALYGLKQGARAWQDTFSSILAKFGFSPLVSSPSTYRRSDAKGETIMGTHVDDLLVKSRASTGAHDTEADRFELDLTSQFKFSKKDLHTGARILGWDLSHDNLSGTIRLSVKKKIIRIAQKYGLQDAKTVTTPMAENALAIFDKDEGEPQERASFPYAQLIGELLWLAINARPDIAFAVQVLSRSIKAPKERHWIAAKRIVRYLMGTQELALQYSSQQNSKPICYSDADWARDPSDRKSVSGYVFLLAGAAVIWKVKRQTVVALSTAEAEYIAASYATREATWIRHFFNEIGRSFASSALQIFVDNQAAIKMTANPVYQSKTKHIDLAVHHIRDQFKSGNVNFAYTPGSENIADIFTKPLPPALHIKCVKALGLC